MSLVIWDHTVLPATRHKWTHPALTPAIQAGTRFTYPGGMEGRVDLVDLIAPRPGVKPATFRSRVQRSTTAPPRQLQSMNNCLWIEEEDICMYTYVVVRVLDSWPRDAWVQHPAIALTTCSHTCLCHLIKQFNLVSARYQHLWSYDLTALYKSIIIIIDAHLWRNVTSLKSSIYYYYLVRKLILIVSILGRTEGWVNLC